MFAEYGTQLLISAIPSLDSRSQLAKAHLKLHGWIYWNSPFTISATFKNMNKYRSASRRFFKISKIVSPASCWPSCDFDFWKIDSRRPSYAFSDVFCFKLFERFLIVSLKGSDFSALFSASFCGCPPCFFVFWHRHSIDLSCFEVDVTWTI